MMQTPTPNISTALGLIATMRGELDRLEALLKPAGGTLDPADPANKLPDGKLSPQGVEVCYSLFDEGMTRYAVKEAMGMSFGAANYRHAAWTGLGGVNREKGQPN